MIAHERALDRVRAAVYARCRELRLEPPTPERIERLVRSALATHEQQVSTAVRGRLSAQSIEVLDGLLTPTKPSLTDGELARAPLVELNTDPRPGRVGERARRDRQTAAAPRDRATVGSGDRIELLGSEPIGYEVFDPNGRVMTPLTSAGRTSAASSSDMAALFKSMIAYTGEWSIDGEKFVTKVDGAWDASWVGTEQVRYYAFDGQTLALRTVPINHPSFPGQKVIAYVDWKRET